MYGGATYKNLNVRLKEHKEEEPEKYIGTKIKLLIDNLELVDKLFKLVLVA